MIRHLRYRWWKPVMWLPSALNRAGFPGAYWLLWSLRSLMPERSRWRTVQFDTLRLRLVKIAARIVEMKTQIKAHLPTSAPDQAIIHLAPPAACHG